MASPRSVPRPLPPHHIGHPCASHAVCQYSGGAAMRRDLHERSAGSARRSSGGDRRCAWCIGVGRGGQRTIIGVRIGASRGRAQRGVAWRWWAGWPASPPTSRLPPSPVRRFWTAPTPIRALLAPRIPSRALAAPRIPIARLAGTTHPLHGAYRSRGRPESPPRPSRDLNRLRRCRPARPPTPQNPPLRAAPRCVDAHPDDPTKTAASHPSMTLNQTNLV
jgi:hypothetical protein